MNENNAIEVRGLSKTFISHADKKNHICKNKHNGVQALKDISFNVPKGDALGIIGANGSGKSSLLRILAGISSPTNGEVQINGKLASAFDVGIGFQHDLSGWDNIILNGQLLGMSRSEIDKKAPEIAAFSELNSFIKTPVKYYSTGMYNRLSFSVMAFLEGEIYLFDEVLSGGDRSFRAKALRHIRNINRKGKTIILVTHDNSEVFYLCKRVIWLEKGLIRNEGAPPQIISEYQTQALMSKFEKKTVSENSTEGKYVWNKIWTSDTAAIPFAIDVLEITSNFPGGKLNSDEAFDITISFRGFQTGDVLDVGFTLFDGSGYNLFAFVTDTQEVISNEFQEFKAKIQFPGQLLNAGTYFLELKVVRNKKEIYPVLSDDLFFHVNFGKNNSYLGLFPGPLKPNLNWSITSQS